MISDIMRIFLALCSECDKFNMTRLVNIMAPDEKMSTVSCNSCGNSNTVLMVTITVPENYVQEEKKESTDGQVDS